MTQNNKPVPVMGEARLPALMCSQGGVPFNLPHLDYWNSRALEAERKLSIHAGDTLSLNNDIEQLRSERAGLLERLEKAEKALRMGQEKRNA